MLDTESVEVSLWLQPGSSTQVVFPLSLPPWGCWRGWGLSPDLMMDLSTSWSCTRGSTVGLWNSTLATSTLLSNTTISTSSRSCFSPRNPPPPSAHKQVGKSDAPSVERSWPTSITLLITHLESFLIGPRVCSLPVVVGKECLWRIYLCWLRT